eukprot:415886-Amphidinium_carterae.1
MVLSRKTAIAAKGFEVQRFFFKAIVSRINWCGSLRDEVWSVGMTICELVTLEPMLKSMYANFLRNANSHREAWRAAIGLSPKEFLPPALLALSLWWLCLAVSSPKLRLAGECVLKVVVMFGKSARL